MRSTLYQHILGGLWGSIVGDALGVPVEFNSRASLQNNPVTSLRGYGTHNQPPGTWSDDSSLLLCTVESLLQQEFDCEDIGRWFCGWYHESLWTPHGEVFDVGGTTAQAISRIAMGTPAVVAGGDDVFNNGNGSLMRIMPIPLRFAGSSIEQLLDKAHLASAITHRHARSQMACGIYSLVVRELMSGADAGEAVMKAQSHFRLFYEPKPRWKPELEYFSGIFEDDFPSRSLDTVRSSGYVVHTLEASLWCLLTTSSYQECVLKAVNLGGDTDTTGCVAGGLAGILYGVDAIPADWVNFMVRKNDLERIFHQFAELIREK